VNRRRQVIETAWIFIIKVAALFFSIIAILFLFSTCKMPDLPEGYYNYKEPPSFSKHPKDNELDERLNLFRKKGLPGGACLVRGGDKVWTGASGYADIDRNIAMDVMAKFRVISVTKPFIAVTMLKLIETQNGVDLNDKISEYLPRTVIEKVDNASIATIRQCLNHTSGIFDYAWSIFRVLDYLNNRDYFNTMEDNLSYLSWRSAYFAPGTDFRYSNTNYLLIGLVIEEITDKPFYTVLKEQVINTLGLHNTYLNPDNPLPSGTVQGYVDQYGDGRLAPCTYRSEIGPAMGLVTNVYDIDKFVEKVVKGSFLEQHLKNEFLNVAGNGYGLGIRKKTYTPPGTTIEIEGYGHDGHGQGYRAFFEYYPEWDVTYIALFNANLGKMEKYYNEYQCILDVLKY